MFSLKPNNVYPFIHKNQFVQYKLNIQRRYKHKTNSNQKQTSQYTIPDYKIYNSIDNCPELLRLKQALDQKGLCDPWIRNEIWRFDKNIWGTPRQRFVSFFFRGFTAGLIAAIFSTIVTKYFEYMDHSVTENDDTICEKKVTDQIKKMVEEHSEQKTDEQEEEEMRHVEPKPLKAE